MGGMPEVAHPPPLVRGLPAHEAGMPLVRTGGMWAVLMPRMWDLLDAEQRRAMASLMGDMIAAEPHAREVQLECLTTIDRIMRLPPNRLAQWPDELVTRTEHEEGPE